MSFYGFRPYVPVAQRRALAAREMEKLRKKGRVISPVVIDGRMIARNFWGKAWCDNLERYSDYENRLPRGRTYVRNGSVVDLQIERGHVRAMVSGSDIYSVKIEIGMVSQARWKAICKDCAGSVGSLVELLQGKLSKHVMERVCREADGLFPAPHEIKMTCSCPDWADMCKHVAAVMYGAGARLDIAPDLLFALRGVDRSELIVDAGSDLAIPRTAVAQERIIAGDDVAALFGIEMAPTPSTPEAKETRKAARSVKPALVQRAASSSNLPTKEIFTSKKQRGEKRPATAPPVVEARQERTSGKVKSFGARTAPAKKEPPDKTVRAIMRRSKKAVSSTEEAEPRTETKSRREIRAETAKRIKSWARKGR
ncbi:SWIM zinc finger family protein [Methylocapsa sp. S129]|uniref:SWIM zinc finger family protein n=1 Tax=Methylocapsa sp. S129 TaxID=1641869 RepID=UPI00131B12D3|nr:SWIM zinc finger family protein [Methylocapsa sp. S129]